MIRKQWALSLAFYWKLCCFYESRRLVVYIENMVLHVHSNLGSKLQCFARVLLRGQHTHTKCSYRVFRTKAAVCVWGGVTWSNMAECLWKYFRLLMCFILNCQLWCAQQPFILTVFPKSPYLWVHNSQFKRPALRQPKCPQQDAGEANHHVCTLVEPAKRSGHGVQERFGSSE